MSAETTARPFQVGDRIKITVRDIMSGKLLRSHTGRIRSLEDMTSPDTEPWVTLIADVDAPYLMGKDSTEHTVAIAHLTADRTRTTWEDSETVELLDDTPEFEVGSIVQQTLTPGIGVVKPREAWFPTRQLDEYPEHIVVEYADGSKTLTHPKWFTLAPEGAAPTNPSGGAVTSTPAPSDDTTPSLVALDRDHSEASVLNAALSWAAGWGDAPVDPGYMSAEEIALLNAARDYRSVGSL